MRHKASGQPQTNEFKQRRLNGPWRPFCLGISRLLICRVGSEQMSRRCHCQPCRPCYRRAAYSKKVHRRHIGGTQCRPEVSTARHLANSRRTDKIFLKIKQMRFAKRNSDQIFVVKRFDRGCSDHAIGQIDRAGLTELLVSGVERARSWPHQQGSGKAPWRC